MVFRDILAVASVALLVGKLSEVAQYQSTIQSINSRINGFLLRPMRLVFTNLWALSGPFQRLAYDSAHCAAIESLFMNQRVSA